jgi:TolB-like protein
LSLFGELKRRNVIKVSLAYILAAWVLLQVGDVILGNISAPDWIFQVLLLFLFLGFPIAVILAWAFELTPTGLKREYEGSRDDPLVESVAPHESKVTAADPQKPAQIDKSIAVLPFVNMSEDASNEYFSDGISEELLNLLAKIPELRVAARTSSFSLKGKELQISEIGEILKVAHVLEGSVRKSGSRLRITAQLIQAKDRYHLWSETFDRTLEDVFATQEEIATEVVGQLKITLLGRAPKVTQADPKVYAQYLQARYLARQGTSTAFEQSIGIYKQVLDLDPNYIAAWDGLAAVYIDQAERAERSFTEGYGLAREAARNAIAIDPDYAKAHARLGLIAEAYDNDLAASARYLKRALSLDPTNLDILGDAAVMAGNLGRLNEAIAIQEYVLARDPVNARGHRRIGYSYLWAGRLDDAINSFRTALTLSPGMLGNQQLIGIAFLLKADPEGALAAIQEESESDNGWREVGLAMAYHALGQSAESDLALARAIELAEQTAAYNIAYVMAFRGEADRAFEWLDKAVRYKDTGLSQIPVVTLFENIHSDSRWLPFLEKIGKSPEQLKAIDFKIAVPE